MRPTADGGWERPDLPSMFARPMERVPSLKCETGKRLEITAVTQLTILISDISVKSNEAYIDEHETRKNANQTNPKQTTYIPIQAIWLKNKHPFGGKQV